MSYTNNKRDITSNIIAVVFIKFVLDLNLPRSLSFIHVFLVWMTIMDKTIDTITTTIFTPFSLVRVPEATPRTLSRAGDDI
jgi:hypothetical protein